MQIVGRKLSRLGQVLTSPPARGGQHAPRPVPQAALVAENVFSNLPGSDALLPIFINKPVKSEIKVSSLKTAYFYLHDGKIFYDKHLPDPHPTFLSRVSPHSQFSPEYFTSLHAMVSAPGMDNPAGTYNFQGARIPLSHTNLNIPKWRELLADYPKSSLFDKLEFGFPSGVSRDPQLEPTLKNHSSSYLFHSWLD